MGGPALVAAATARPFAMLSLGERTIVALARLFDEPNPPSRAPAADGAAARSFVLAADEFTSYLDRDLAAHVSHAFGRAWRKCRSERLVVATVHADLLRWLRPDWEYRTADHAQLSYTWHERDGPPGAAAATGGGAEGSGGGFSFAPPAVDIVLRPTNRVGDGAAYKMATWDRFKEHHYMSSNLSVTASCNVARWARGWEASPNSALDSAEACPVMLRRGFTYNNNNSK